MARYPHIVLASASPRRAALLDQIGVTYDVSPADIVEAYPDALSPAEGAESVARDKALAVARAASEDTPVLGADTVVILDAQALGKPADVEDARHTLRRLSGRSHVVATGVAVVSDGGSRVESWVVESTVTFRDVAESEIEAYVASGRPMDKAGSYGIQEDAAAFVERVDGCYYAVVGLPLARLSVVLRTWKARAHA